MIRIAIDLVPRGIHIEETRLYTMTITNDGSGSLEVGNYKVRLKANQGQREETTCEIKDYDRLKKDILPLLKEALEGLNV